MIGHVQLKKKLPKIKGGRFCQVNFLGSIFFKKFKLHVQKPFQAIENNFWLSSHTEYYTNLVLVHVVISKLRGCTVVGAVVVHLPPDRAVRVEPWPRKLCCVLAQDMPLA